MLKPTREIELAFLMTDFVQNTSVFRHFSS